MSALPPGEKRLQAVSRRTAEVAVSETPDPAVRAAILDGLARSNRAYVSDPDMRPLIVVIEHPAGGDLYGGLWGRTAWDWLYIELLFVSEQARGIGWGTKLVRAAETEALRRNCRNAWVDTYSFQARGFYERLGYAVFGTLDDYPAGHQRFFLRRSLV